jgi:hypothetical protein
MSSRLTPVAVDFRQVSAAVGSGDAALLERLLTKYRIELEEADEIASELEEDEDAGDDDDDDDEDSRAASLRALSQLLGQAKKNLEGGRPPDEVLSDIGRAAGVSPQHQHALRDLLSDSGGADDRDDANASQAEYASAADVLRHMIIGEMPARRVAFKFMYGYGLQYLCQYLGEELPSEQWGDLRGSSWARDLDKALKAVGVPAMTLSVTKHLARRGSPFEIVPRYSDAPEIGYLNRPEVAPALAALLSAKLGAIGHEERPLLEDIRGWLQTCSDSERDLICFCA